MRELTAGEIKDIMQAFEKAAEDKDFKISIIDMLFPDSPLPALAVAKANDLKIEDIEKLPPSEIEKKIKEAEKFNPFFMKMMERTEALLRQ